jgi:hypothetical protein
MDMIIEKYNNVCAEEKDLMFQMEQVEKQLQEIGDKARSIVVKKIQGKLYYYEQWSEEGKTVSRSLGRVAPGAIAEKEAEIEKRKVLLSKKKKLIFLLQQAQKEKKALEKEKKQMPVIEDYAFEVFWKNELTARVIVDMDEVKVSRFCIHPVKQIFASSKMTRYQLNQILAMRCFDRNRDDAQEKLKALGLDYYNPYEIVKRTHGVSYNDYIWIRFPKENLQAEDVLVRSI